MSELEDNIKSSVSFHSVAATGYHTLQCPVCQDKKVRAGFHFSSDKIVYSCFRGKCDASTEYVYGEHMFKKFRYLMDTFGIDVPLDLKFTKKHTLNEDYDEEIYEKHFYESIEFPDDFVRYDVDKHYWFQELLKKRCIDFNRNLYVGQEGEWKYKLIVPFYVHNKLIGWQGISYNSDTEKSFYLTSSGNTDIMYINDHSGFIPHNPIVVEGIMDAGVLPDSVATLGNTVSRKQAYILRNSSPILLPDRKDSNFLSVAKRYGWRISIPEWKVKDVNEAVQKHGPLIAAKMIHDGIQENILKAEVRYNLWRTKR